jgi:UDP-2,3-diacylglucosamine pyrophosphatase LpxH
LTVLFILGDLFDHSKPRDPEKGLKFLLRALGTLTVQVIIIPGFIEPALMREQITQFMGTNIISNKVSDQDGQIIHLKHARPRPGTCPSIFITYNSRCTRPIRPSESHVFLQCFKQKYATVRIMTVDGLLMVGAVHKHIVRETHKTFGLDQFSFDNKTLFYAMITAEGAFHVNYANLPVPEIKQMT